jgi:hypothetical protein
MQSLFKENELEAYVILAQLCHDGWLPLQQLLPAKSVRAWFKEYEPQAALHPSKALQVLSAKLSQQSLPSGDNANCIALQQTSNTLDVSVYPSIGCR